MTTPEGLISRKRVAELMGKEVSPRMVARNEKRWGLDAARVDLNGWHARFRAWQAIKILRQQGLIE